MSRPVVITVCVNYWDFLRQTLPYTLRHAKHVYVVTTPDFEYGDATIHPDDDVTVLMTPVFYDNAAFNKAGAVRSVQTMVHKQYPDDWILLLDADIVIPDECVIPSSLDRQTMYGAERVDFSTPEEYAANTPSATYSVMYAGYFQLYFDKSKLYGMHSNDASGCDMDFASSFPARKMLRLPVPLKHLGCHTKNWKGRTTGAW